MKIQLLLAFTLAATANGVKHILSFGGNGMIGSEVLHKLISDTSEEYDITLVSRGSWPFDAADRVKPHVRFAKCDRKKDAPCAGESDCNINTLTYCEDLMKVVNATEKFDAVLDFSAYEPKWVHDAIHALKEKVGVYVYISSDSVYDVSNPKGSERRTLETDSIRPNDLQTRRELIAAERYGDAKLSGEEALKNQREDGGFPYITLRYSDIVGPRDTTYRWQLYHIWVKMYHDLKRPLPVPIAIANVTESLTFATDAADAVILAMNTPSAWDETYNIAMEEEFKLWDLMQLMASVLEVEGIDQVNEIEEKPTHLFPTVFGGSVDISKAKEKLGFKPTDPRKAFEETVAYYDVQFVEDETEREEILKRFLMEIFPKEAKDSLYLAVGNLLEKHGVVNEKYHKKRKGDLGEAAEEHDEL